MAKKSSDIAGLALLIGALFGLIWSLFKYPVQTIIGISILIVIFAPDYFWVAVLVDFFVIVIYLANKNSNRKAATSHIQQHIDERNTEEYKDRQVDLSKNLFERNKDIIEKFQEKIQKYSYERYYIDNKTRDCINEICLAENTPRISPGYSYLSDWRPNAPQEWKDLADLIKNSFQERQKQLSELESTISNTNSKLQKLLKDRVNPSEIRKIKNQNGRGQICIEEITDIITPNSATWTEREKHLLKVENKSEKFPAFQSNIKHKEIKDLNEKIDEYNNLLDLDAKEKLKNKTYFKKIADGYKNKIKEDFISRLNYVISNIDLPLSIPKIWDINFDTDENIAIVEIALPDVVHNEIYKKVLLKSGTVKKLLNQKEIKDRVPNIHPAVMLRVAYEIFKDDYLDLINLLVLNGWVEYDDPSTGLKTKTYTASLAVQKNQIKDLNLAKLEPLTAFLNLKGKSAGKLIEIIPVTPTLSLNKEDPRFIKGKDILKDLGTETNLAVMDWQDFEHLIRELFERVFEKEGAEVKVTQASRDRGVDAVVFDPDPIKGGKFIIQAKRYTNTVDVSSVRDLCAVVNKEGASRGIMVTTSSYGADAYAFANGQPVTLINGSELLGLLKQYGYKFKIDLAEARKLNIANQK